MASANIKNEYESLGVVTFAEKMIMSLFVLLLTLWLTRAPGGKGTGWSVYFKDGFVTDGSSALFVAFLLFILPGEMPFQRDEKGAYITAPPLISWKQMTTKMGWGVIFLLGGGFAMAGGITSSGLGKFVGIKMSGLSSQYFMNCLFFYFLKYLLLFSTNLYFGSLYKKLTKNI